MTVVRMPGKNRPNFNGGARVDTRNCYMSDEEVAIRAERVMAFEQVEAEHSLPALIWWALVSLAAVVSFAAGLLLGSRM